MFYVYTFLAFIGGVIILSIPAMIIGDRKLKRKIEEVFGGRQSLDERDFYEKHFAAKGVPFFIVKKIREILEEVLDADLSRLSAEDDFSRNLSFFWEEDSLADVEILEKIEEEFEIKISDEEAASLRTVDEIVDSVWRKVRGKDEFQN
ncbi:MAG TPA: phosphopantetheine-binding protein [Pyrinomonadaceae bacterium]|jgi:acyl carrier protein